MEYATLGLTGMNVSRICLGTMTFGSPLDEQQCKELVSHALDVGVNFFDTSNAYEGYDRQFGVTRGGTGEGLLGEALAGRRDEAIVCTKLGNPVGPSPLHAGLSPRHIEIELEKSLRRLGSDYVDILLAHRTDPAVVIEDVWYLFDRLVKAGKVRCVGVSNWPSWMMAKAAELAAQHGWPRVAASSPRYSLLRREIEAEHIPCAQHYNLGLFTYQALAGGLLSGKYRRGQAAPEGTRGAEKPAWLPPMDDSFFDRLEALERIAQRSGMSVLEYAIAWPLSRPTVTSVVVGCRNATQLDQAIAAASKTIPAEDAEEVDALFPPATRPGGEQVMRWRGKWVLEDM